MARVAGIAGTKVERLADGWQLVSLPPDAARMPPELSSRLDWLPALVPGTVAAARERSGSWSLAEPAPLHDADHWYRVRVRGEGCRVLRFHGLATLATVFLDGREILAAENMFRRHDVPVTLSGEHELHIRFRALSRALAEPRPAGRWRPRMMTASALRHVRTTTLGHMPGWCPEVHAVGPWRAVELVTPGPLALVRADVRAHLDDGTGVVVADLAFARDPGGAGTLRCAGHAAAFTRTDAGSYTARLEIPEVAPWWPHTHGAPALHAVEALFGDARIDLGRTGFRRIEIDRGIDGRGFGLVVNGVPVFCRGAVWSSASLVRLPEAREELAPVLLRARDAGFDMLRVPGTTVYEADAFYDLCDELGILVWQDFMLANFDYPVGDAHFMSELRAEATDVLDRIQLSPSIAVLCGGSEVYQQAALLGLPPRKYVSPIFETELPGIAHTSRPDVPWVAGSPSGGALPFVVDEGVGHYFGVGAYCRPLADARHANVRFASECLAFANVPPEIAAAGDEAPLTTVTDPRWRPRIPHDVGAAWNFEDVRDHYVAETFGSDMRRLRASDPDGYLELSRMTQAAVAEHVFTEWMRPASPTRGGLVLMLQDLQAGAGWGLLTAAGEPKSTWYVLRRLFRPLRVTLTDEGVNGLAVHLANETAETRPVTLRLAAWRDGRLRVLQAERAMELAPRSSETLNAFALVGSFFDIAYAYRFQPPQHDASVATLLDRETGDVLSEAFHFPLGHQGRVAEAALTAAVTHNGDAWALELEATRLARFVHIVDEAYEPEDDWLHLAPGRRISIRLRPRRAAAGVPQGEVRALNLVAPLRYRGMA